MIALDTNVVVRLLVEDDEAQSRAAQEIHEQSARNGETVLITDIVLCELEWVLDSAYRIPRVRILQALQQLLGDDRFTFQDRALVNGAVERYQEGKGDLSDYLLGLRAESEGASTTHTFDKALHKERGFSGL